MSTITRSALGRVVSLGALYDARKDLFVGANIFNQKLPENSIKSLDNGKEGTKFAISDSLSQKFTQLNVNA